MIKILPIEKIRKADAYTIKNEPIPSIDLMERAAFACFEWLKPFLKKKNVVRIFCGPGNNGGDGLAIARMLCNEKFKVDVWILKLNDKTSEDFKTNIKRLNQQGKVLVTEIYSINEVPEIIDNDILIDAIFGSGLTKPVTGFVAEVISRMNNSKAVKIAIDIPTGLYGDRSSIMDKGMILKADYTLSFQFPKYAFLFAENDEYVGDWHILPIGLHPDYIDNAKVKNYFTTLNSVRQLLKMRQKFSHKGTYGHAILIAGSYGKMGAAVLASKACLRSGVGLLTTHIPNKGNYILQSAVPEAMLSLDRFENYVSNIPDLSNCTAIGIGPGLGMQEQTANAIKVLIQNAKVPLLFDADALNILAENKTWLGFLPPNSILTPHPKEFERLAGKTSSEFERIDKAKAFAVKHRVIIVLKGAHTCICTPSGDCYFNSTGNPGMATAGSGDVLTGVILGILAQGYISTEACILGVFIHGLAGDIASDKIGAEALIAGDIIEKLGKAFKKLY